MWKQLFSCLSLQFINTSTSTSTPYILVHFDSHATEILLWVMFANMIVDTFPHSIHWYTVCCELLSTLTTICVLQRCCSQTDPTWVRRLQVQQHLIAGKGIHPCIDKHNLWISDTVCFMQQGPKKSMLKRLIGIMTYNRPTGQKLNWMVFKLVDNLWFVYERTAGFRYIENFFSNYIHAFKYIAKNLAG